MEVDGVVKPLILGTRSTQNNLLTENPEAGWIALTGDGISVINSVRIPEEHKGHLDVSPYLIEVRGTPDTDDAKPAPEVEAGFLFKTTGKTPDGDHVIHSIFLFDVNSNRKEYLANAIQLLRQKLIITPVTLEQ